MRSRYVFETSLNHSIFYYKNIKIATTQKINTYKNKLNGTRQYGDSSALALSVWRNVRLIGELLRRVEIAAPATAASSVRIVAATAETVFVVLVMVRMGHHFIRHVLLLAKEFFQTYDGGKHQGELTRR